MRNSNRIVLMSRISFINYRVKSIINAKLSYCESKTPKNI